MELNFIKDDLGRTFLEGTIDGRIVVAIYIKKREDLEAAYVRVAEVQAQIDAVKTNVFEQEVTVFNPSARDLKKLVDLNMVEGEDR